MYRFLSCLGLALALSSTTRAEVYAPGLLTDQTYCLDTNSDGSRKEHPPFSGVLRLSDGTSAFCQVTIVTANHGVAAASCFDYHEDGTFSGVYRVAIGLCPGTPISDVGVRNVYKHPSYNSFSYANNIAIVEFDSPVDASSAPQTISYTPSKWAPNFTYAWRREDENHQFTDLLTTTEGTYDQNVCAQQSTLFADNQQDFICSEAYIPSNYGEGCIRPYHAIDVNARNYGVRIGFYSHSYVLNDLYGFYCKGHEGMLHYYILIANYIPWIKSIAGDFHTEGVGEEPTDKNYAMKTNEQISSLNAEPFTWYMWDQKVPRPDFQQDQPQSQPSPEEQVQPQLQPQPQPQPQPAPENQPAEPVKQPVEPEPQTSTSTQTITETNTITEEGDVITETFTTAYINEVLAKETVDVVTTVQTTDIAMDTVTETSTVTEQSTETESSTVTETLMLTQTMSTTDELTTTQVSQSMCPTVEQCVPETSVNQITVMETVTGEVVTETTNVVSTILPSFVPGPGPIGPYTITVTVPGTADQYTETETMTQTSLVSASDMSMMTMTVTDSVTRSELSGPGTLSSLDAESTTPEPEEASSSEAEKAEKVKGGGLPTPAIIGIVLLLVLILLGLLIGYVCWRRHKRQKEQQDRLVYIPPPPLLPVEDDDEQMPPHYYSRYAKN